MNPYWEVGDYKYSTKVEAIIASDSTRQKISFHCFGPPFDRMDWTVEPKFSWKELLKQRAEQLRSTYDYIRLFYSGGVDSLTAMNAFLENKIPIDEIVCIRFCPTGEAKHFSNTEVNDCAIPHLKLLEKNIPKTKITILDYNPPDYEKWFSGEWLEKKFNLDFSPHAGQIYHCFPKMKTPRTLSGSVCNLQGGQKPKIERTKEGFFAYYFDSNLEFDMGDDLIGFYTSDEFPEVHLKQCHLLKNRMKEKYPDLYDYSELYRLNSKMFLEDLDGCCRDPLWGSAALGKNTSILSPKSALILQEVKKVNPQLFDKYYGPLSEIKRYEKKWFNRGELLWNFVGIRSHKRYFLGE